MLTNQMTWHEICQKIMKESNCFEKRYYDWLMEKERLGGLLFSSLTYFRLYNIWKKVNFDDRDHFICISGKEGTGKSTLSIQCACVLDDQFCLDRVCYQPSQFINGIDTSEKGYAFSLDEGNLFLFSRESSSENNRMMVKLFALMRQKNLIVIICVPNFHTLDSYIRDHRVDTLIHYKEKGKYHIYTGKAINIISKEGYKYKKVEGIKVPHGSFAIGYNNKMFPKLNDINIDSYKKHKEEHFQTYLNDIKELLRVKNERKDTLQMLNIDQSMKIIGSNRKTLTRMLKKGEIKGRKIGSKWYITRESINDLSMAHGPASAPCLNIIEARED